MVDFSASLVHRIFLGKNIDQPVSSSLGPHPTTAGTPGSLGTCVHKSSCWVPTTSPDLSRFKSCNGCLSQVFVGGGCSAALWKGNFSLKRMFQVTTSFWTEANVATEGLRGCGLYFSLNAPRGWHTSVHATGPVALVLGNRSPVSSRGLHAHMQIQKKISKMHICDLNITLNMLDMLFLGKNNSALWKKNITSHACSASIHQNSTSKNPDSKETSGWFSICADNRKKTNMCISILSTLLHFPNENLFGCTSSSNRYPPAGRGWVRDHTSWKWKEILADD